MDLMGKLKERSITYYDHKFRREGIYIIVRGGVLCGFGKE